MNTLRGRLILSHIIPWLLVAPLIGITIFYLLRTQASLTQLSTHLTQQALSVSRLASVQPAIFTDLSQAELFMEVYVEELGGDPENQLSILQLNGDLLETNLEDDPAQLEQLLTVLNRNLIMASDEGYFRIQVNLAHVFMPVKDVQDRVLGMIAVSDAIDDATARLPMVRRTLILALILELIVGMAAGIGLSAYIGRDLSKVTEAVSEISSNQHLEKLPEQGPEEIRTLIKAYNTTVERLKDLEESRRQLLANIVHEIARPIGAIQAAVQALLVGGDQDPQFRQELLQGMESQLNRLQPLLDNLTRLHNQVFEAPRLNLQPTQLSNWLREISATWQAAAQKKGIRWEADIHPQLPTLKIDPDRLAQAVGNLLSNAVKYTPQDGLIHLSAAEREEYVVIAIQDSGPGIAPEEQELIFIPFYRSQADTRFPQGMGLGLSIAQEIVEAHGARLTLTSQRGKGSTFTIELPKSPQLED
jgi:two-component system sensor histidine kinase BaeS